MHDLVTSHEYPLFTGGQTLTAAELNTLQEFLHDRDRLIGRMAGFGVNAGLGAQVSVPGSGARLTVQPGLAVDQVGEPLMLEAPHVIELPPTDTSPAPDFIDASPGGRSVLLEMVDEPLPTPDCGEADCTAHAAPRLKRAAVRTVPGRLSGTYLDFVAEPLLAVQPLTLSRDSRALSSYGDLRDAVADRLTNTGSPLVEPALIAALRSTRLRTSDLPGVQGYKAGWLNMVLFATLDLLRAEALLSLSWDRSTSTPAVVLGWLHFEGGAWQLDCRYRHAWEPPRGLTEALLGGTCGDPLSRYREEVRGLLAGFAPPDPARPPTSPEKPRAFGKNAVRITGRGFVSIVQPGEVIDGLADWFVPVDVPGINERSLWSPPKILPEELAWEVYGGGRWDAFDDGVLDAADYLGQKADAVQPVVEDYIVSKGGVADVRVVKAGEEGQLDGYRPSSGFSPSDTVVFVVGADNSIVATGRVPATTNVGRVGNRLPVVEEAVTRAEGAAARLGDAAEGFDRTLQGLDARLGDVVGDVSRLDGDLASMRGEGFTGGRLDARVDGLEGRQGALEGVDTRVDRLEQQQGDVKDFAGRVSSLEGKVDVLGKVTGGGRVTRPGLDDVGFARGIIEFTESTVAAMETLDLDPVANRSFRRHIAETQRTVTELEGAIATDDSAQVGLAALKTLRTMRTMVKASGVNRNLGTQLDEQLRDLGSLLGQ